MEPDEKEESEVVEKEIRHAMSSVWHSGLAGFGLDEWNGFYVHGFHSSYDVTHR